MENVVISLALKQQVFVESSKANDFTAFYKSVFGAEEVNRTSHPMRKASRELLLLLFMVIMLGSTCWFCMDSTLDLNTFDSLIASNNEESFVASEIEVHPINDDPIIFVDEEHDYVPNLPLLRGDCYEISSNGDIDAPFGPPHGPKVTTSEDVQQSKKANGEVVLKIQKEIVKGKLFCYVSHTEQVQDKVVYFVTHLNKDNSVTNVFLVVTGPTIGNYDCSCRNFTRIVRELSSNKSSDPVDSISKISNVEDIQNLVGGSLDVDLQCSNPQGIRNKGCGKSRRLIGAGEKVVEKSLQTPRLCRTCQKYVTGHDSRNCKKKRTEVVDVTEE
ncbi:hypothetical protein E3N88_33108 [Mikania micrantha]|uniref:Glyoxalase At5g48480-like N-terminal domain-containing protein n=1 Tax=Mikania micrantha TaxID=192012 RepID=A0A5N6MD04_9ASTR|nr:hypothetical protein E3N88_33108 [Mikania micrantha]